MSLQNPGRRTVAEVSEDLSIEGQVTQVELLGAIAPGWTLIQPLPVWIKQDEDGDYLVSDEKFFVYGEGATIPAARRDYIDSLIEYYTIVASYDDLPSQELLASLQDYLQPTNSKSS
jgi:hypothetical protein